MDLDALLGLLFFVVFVVVPMITGARRRGKGAKGQQQGRQQPGQQQQGQQTGQQGRAGQGQGQGQLLGRPSTQGPGSGRLGSPMGSGAQQAAPSRQADHPASNTLEEIRRRVQQAQQREEQERSRGPDDGRRTADRQPRSARGLVSSDPFERGLVSGSGKTLSGESIGREGTSSEWPPPGGDLLAGRPVTSVIGREGTQGQAQAQTSGQPSVLGREGLPPGPGSLAGGRSGSLGREGQVVQPQLQRRRSGRSGTGLGREGSRGLGAMPMSKRSSLGREGRSPRRASLETGEIGAGDAQPVLSPYGAKVGGSSLVNVDRDGIVAGLIWHEILKEAPGKKRLRRTRSRPQ